MEKPQDIGNFSTEELTVFLNSFDTIMSDCDGVLWHLSTPIPGALNTLKTLEQLGKRVFFVSNNSTLLVEDYVKKIEKMGFQAKSEQIVIPSLVILWYLRRIKFEGKALVIGATPFRKVLEDGGINVITGPTEIPEGISYLKDMLQLDLDVRAVIFDLDCNLSWAKMVLASLYLMRKDVIFLTGGLDINLPVSKNLSILGMGQFSDILVERTGKKPIECAKPSKQLENYLLQHCGIENPKRCIFIGDSLSADMKFAQSCGFTRFWVGSGLDTMESWEVKKTEISAEYYLSDLGSLDSLIEKSKTNGINQHRMKD